LHLRARSTICSTKERDSGDRGSARFDILKIVRINCVEALHKHKPLTLNVEQTTTTQIQALLSLSRQCLHQLSALPSGGSRALLHGWLADLKHDAEREGQAPAPLFHQRIAEFAT
jgi:hypothetical protein